jgi:hypothetical protein
VRIAILVTDGFEQVENFAISSELGGHQALECVPARLPKDLAAVEVAVEFEARKRCAETLHTAITAACRSASLSWRADLVPGNDLRG